MEIHGQGWIIILFNPYGHFVIIRQSHFCHACDMDPYIHSNRFKLISDVSKLMYIRQNFELFKS
jgi:hypothetical protein